MVYPERLTTSGIINRYKQKGIEGLLDLLRRPHNIRYKKITSEVEQIILDLRLTKRFGCKNRIKFSAKKNHRIVIKHTNYIQETKEIWP